MRCREGTGFHQQSFSLLTAPIFGSDRLRKRDIDIGGARLSAWSVYFSRAKGAFGSPAAIVNRCDADRKKLNN